MVNYFPFVLFSLAMQLTHRIFSAPRQILCNSRQNAYADDVMLKWMTEVQAGCAFLTRGRRLIVLLPSWKNSWYFTAQTFAVQVLVSGQRVRAHLGQAKIIL